MASSGGKLLNDRVCPMCGKTRVHLVYVCTGEGEHYWEDTYIYLWCGMCFFESEHWRKNRSWRRKLKKMWLPPQ